MFKLSKVIAFTVTVALLIFSTHAYGVLQDRELYFELPWYATLTNVTTNSRKIETLVNEGPIGYACQENGNGQGIGLAYPENSVYGDDNDVSQSFTVGEASCIYPSSVHYDDTEKFYIEVGNDNSTAISGFFDKYSSAYTTSGVTHTSMTSYEQSSGMVVNGRPTTLAFAFFADLEFTVGGYQVTCNNILFSRQYSNSESSSNTKKDWEVKGIDAAVGIFTATFKLIDSDFANWTPLLKALIKIGKDIAHVFEWLAHEENTWFVMQVFPSGETSSFVAAPGSDFNTNNPTSQYQAAIYCTGPEENAYFLALTHDGDDNDTFNADFVQQVNNDCGIGVGCTVKNDEGTIISTSYSYCKKCNNCIQSTSGSQVTVSCCGCTNNNGSDSSIQSTVTCDDPDDIVVVDGYLQCS